MAPRRILIGLSMFLFTVLPCSARVWDVTALGAKGDKQTSAGPAIQAAIDQCAAAGGGTVLIPAGDYLCGQLNLKSNVTLHVEAGATLWVSPKKEDYRAGNRFLFAEGQSNLTIQGRGTIHGTGEADLARRKTTTPEQRPEFRVGILELVRCKDVTIRDVTVRYSDSWTFDLERCENVVIDGVSIDALRVFIPDEVFSKYPRSALSVYGASNAVIRDVQRRPAGADSDVPVVVLEDVPKGAVRD